MQKRKRQLPTYGQRKGYDQAIVTPTDSVTGYRKDYWLGPYGSPESREMYHRVLAQWESGGRRLPVTLDDRPADITQVSVAEVINAYWKWAIQQYGHSELGCLRVVIRLLRQMFGSTPAADFGPTNRLRVVRDQMILGGENEDPPRKPLARTTVNHNVHRLRAILKWAGSHEMVPARSLRATQDRAGASAGASAARESAPVQSVAVEQIEAVRPYLSRQVNALVSLQLYTGARGGELFRLRPIDIPDSRGHSGIWTIKPVAHKNGILRPHQDDLPGAAVTGRDRAVSGRQAGRRLPLQPGRGGSGATGRRARQAQDPGAPRQPSGDQPMRVAAASPRRPLQPQPLPRRHPTPPRSENRKRSTVPVGPPMVPARRRIGVPGSRPVAPHCRLRPLLSFRTFARISHSLPRA